MSRVDTIAEIDSRKLLVERVAASSYLKKSARLREMFLYLCQQVVDEGATEIHEHEVGHKVFGRPIEYDTAIDNIVRVHASTLRKRIEQYFAHEGIDEPVIIDVPKGNYAPVFRSRPAPFEPAAVPVVPTAEKQADWKLWLLTVLTFVFLTTTLILAFRSRPTVTQAATAREDQVYVRQFWSQIFGSGQTADVVLDDAALGVLQELNGTSIPLNEYFDRTYLRSLPSAAAGGRLDPKLAGSLALKRQSSYAGAALLWKLARTSAMLQSDAKLHFARDFSFRELKTDNIILLGNSRSNPWIQPFESHLGLRWTFDKDGGTYYPVDTRAAAKDANQFHTTGSGEQHEGYAAVSLLPNLNGTGKVLIISATGGSAAAAAIDFLSDERALARLRASLPSDKSADFPFFETLLKVRSRETLPRDTSIVFSRPILP